MGKGKKIITFTSDFGYKNGWEAQCKAIILKIIPSAIIIDITHQIPNYDIWKGSFILSYALLPFSPAVHLAVVDPGVGTSRRPIVIKTKSGDYLVGPDNGLLVPPAKSLGGIEKVVEITNDKLWNHPVCPTFHARDIFAPVAAYIAKGVDIKQVGEEIFKKSLIKELWDEAKIDDKKILAQVLDIDEFGSVRLNVSSNLLKKLGVKTKLPVRIKEEIYINVYKFTNKNRKMNLGKIPFKETFGYVNKGDSLLLIDSSNYLTLAINAGNASKKYSIKRGDKLLLKVM
jgi:hypothetical protein